MTTSAATKIVYYTVAVERMPAALSYSRDFPTLEGAKDYANDRIVALKSAATVELSCLVAGRTVRTPIKTVHTDDRGAVVTVKTHPRPEGF